MTTDFIHCENIIVIQQRTIIHGLAILSLLMIASGCGHQDYNIKQLAKSDVDMVTDTVLKLVRDELKELLIKLYKRNPDQLAKNPGMKIEHRLHVLFQNSGHLQFLELQNIEEVAAINLAFSDEFDGDRVFALMVGLTAMLRKSYNYNRDFYIYNDLDAQALYNSARNIEVMAWQLRHKKNAQGQPFIITSTLYGIVDNTSFERIYGKLIHTQDIMARIIADKDNRTINTVIKGTLSVFLPI